jgi:hypothetical protein
LAAGFGSSARLGPAASMSDNSKAVVARIRNVLPRAARKA